MNSHKGFTLVEVLAAFVVFVIIFATLMELTTVAMRGVSRSKEDTVIALWAESKLAEIKSHRSFAESAESGDFRGGRWELQVSSYDEPWLLVTGSNSSPKKVPLESSSNLTKLVLTVFSNNREVRFVSLVSRFSDDNPKR